MAQELRKAGFKAWALRGGFQAWVDAGFPTEPRQVEARHTLADVCPACGRPWAEHGAA